MSRGGDFAEEIRSEQDEVRLEPRTAGPAPSQRRNGPVRLTRISSGAAVSPARRKKDTKRLRTMLDRARSAAKKQPSWARGICRTALESPKAEVALPAGGGRTYEQEFRALLTRLAPAKPAQRKRKGKKGGPASS